MRMFWAVPTVLLASTAFAQGDPQRAFDPATRQWSIWWLDGRTPSQIDTPMRGGFDKDGVGLFLADDTFEGRPIRVRFLWSHRGPNSARWEQAFSLDGGESWEVNWVMDFERQA